MQLARRIAEITGGAADGWETYYRARALIESGTPVLNLTIGEHDIRTDSSILRAMYESAIAGNTGYAFGPGKRDLRTAIAERVERRTGAHHLGKCHRHPRWAVRSLCRAYGALRSRRSRALH